MKDTVGCAEGLMGLAQLLSQALGKEGEFWREKVLVPSICSNIKPRTQNNKEYLCGTCAEFISTYKVYALFRKP